MCFDGIQGATPVVAGMFVNFAHLPVAIPVYRIGLQVFPFVQMAIACFFVVYGSNQFAKTFFVRKDFDFAFVMT